jgi:GNAT superfamily N-acetyltransferase
MKPMQFNINELKFEKLDLQGVETLVEWARQEGWNPGLNDAQIFYQTDNEGHYGFFLHDKLIAGGSIVSYNGEFGFMGLFIVQPAFRSVGLGKELWFKRRDMLISRLQPGASIGMDGVVSMQPFYQKGGFVPAFRDERYMKHGEYFPPDPTISSIGANDFEMIAEFDKSCFGFGRKLFLTAWLNNPNSKSFKLMINNHLQGYAILRKTYNGYKIGPLFANNETVAESLYKACLSNAQGEEVFLDIPVNNPAAVELIKKFDAAYIFECARMYYGHTPKVDLNKVFGITTFELG